MKKIILYPFLSAIMLMLAVSGNIKAQDLRFTIRLDKTNYKQDDPVKCTMTIKNIGKKDLVVNNRFLVNLPVEPHEVSLVITDPDNRPVMFASVFRVSFNNDKFITLHPGDSTSNTYTLTDDFSLMQAGYYKVLAYYENKTDAPTSLKMPSAWKGILISNKTWFSLR